MKLKPESVFKWDIINSTDFLFFYSGFQMNVNHLVEKMKTTVKRGLILRSV